MVEGCGKVGMKLDHLPKIPQLLRDAGFVDLKVEWFCWPTVSLLYTSKPIYTYPRSCLVESVAKGPEAEGNWKVGYH